MKTYETIGTVLANGQVHVMGVPFATGTEVQIAISPKAQVMGQANHPSDAQLTAARERMQELFLTIKGFRNSPRLPREELYERGRLH